MGQDTKDIIDLVAKILAGVGVGIALFTFWVNTKTRRGEWLKSLFEKFYEKSEFKEVRRWIESGEIEKKIDASSMATPDDEKLADYLNFFEFIAMLHYSKRLKQADVDNLFDYYLRKINKSAKCMEWVNRPDYGFEKLRQLLIKYK